MNPWFHLRSGVRRAVRKGLGQVIESHPPSPIEVQEFDDAVRDLVAPIFPAPDGYLWVSEEFSCGKMPGEEVEVTRGKGVMVDFTTALVPTKRGWIKARKLKIEDVPAFADEVATRCQALEDPALKRDLISSSDFKKHKVEGNEETLTPDDARVLVIDYDAQGERYKEFRMVVRESEDFTFKDWPLERPLCTLHLLKQMYRNGSTPKGWLQIWARFKGIHDNDRIMFELRTLVEAIEIGAMYDQLNIPALASFETVARRIMAIVDAFNAGTSASPDWGAARIITGYRGPEDIVSPQLRQWAARKGKEEVDLQ